MYPIPILSVFDQKLNISKEKHKKWKGTLLTIPDQKRYISLRFFTNYQRCSIWYKLFHILWYMSLNTIESITKNQEIYSIDWLYWKCYTKSSQHALCSKSFYFLKYNIIIFHEIFFSALYLRKVFDSHTVAHTFYTSRYWVL